MRYLSDRFRPVVLYSTNPPEGLPAGTVIDVEVLDVSTGKILVERCVKVNKEWVAWRRDVFRDDVGFWGTEYEVL